MIKVTYPPGAGSVWLGYKIIITMHKSNAVPICSDEEAAAISRMRRG
jgi:hypothetical protein